MSVKTQQAVSVTYAVAAFSTLAVALVLLSTGIENEVAQTFVVLGSAVVGLLSMYYLFGGDRNE